MRRELQCVPSGKAGGAGISGCAPGLGCLGGGILGHRHSACTWWERPPRVPEVLSSWGSVALRLWDGWSWETSLHPRDFPPGSRFAFGGAQARTAKGCCGIEKRSSRAAQLPPEPTLGEKTEPRPGSWPVRSSSSTSQLTWPEASFLGSDLFHSPESW